MQDLPQRAAISTSPPTRAQRGPSASNGKGSYIDKVADKMRKKIWGTETPPGQEDPYGDRSFVGERNKNMAEDNQESADTSEIAVASEQAIDQGEYVPATTWDGLEHIGGATGWWEDAWDQEHQFKG